MSFSKKMILMNKNIIPLSTIYETNDDYSDGKRTIYKTVDKTIKPGDKVIVPTSTRYEFTVVKVDKVGRDDVPVDYNSEGDIGWIAGRVDTEAHDKIIQDEKHAISLMKLSEDRKAAKEIEKNMREAHDDIDFGSLAIAQLGCDTPEKEETPTE